MTGATTLLGMNLTAARKREADAKARRERQLASPEVREARAALLDERNAHMSGRLAAAEAEQRAKPDAVNAVLAHATLDELHQLARVVGQLDGRRMAEFVADEIRGRRRTAYVPAPESSQEAPPAPEASTTSRRR